MVQYNIIYTSAGQPYIWNGSGFDKLGSTSREHLLYSGPIINEENLAQTMQQCRDAIQSVFTDAQPDDLKFVKVGVMTNKSA